MDVLNPRDQPKVPPRHNVGIRHLKIKVKTLAAEAMLIRREERKVMSSANWAARRDLALQRNTMSLERVEYLNEYQELHHHRKVDVRQEARSALLAYAFLRGRRLVHADSVRKTRPNWMRVSKIISAFSGVTWADIQPEFRQWIDDANLPEFMGPYK